MILPINIKFNKYNKYNSIPWSLHTKESSTLVRKTLVKKDTSPKKHQSEKTLHNPNPN